MKTIRALKIIINFFYVGLLIIPIIIILLFIVAYNVSLEVQSFSQIYAKSLHVIFDNSLFGWKVFLAPLSNIISYILFVFSIFYLRKSVSSFEKLEYYSKIVSLCFKKAGVLFIVIGFLTIFMNLITLVYVQNMIQLNKWITFFNTIYAVLEIKIIFLLIVGFFFLFFGKSFEVAQKLKQENDLTI